MKKMSVYNPLSLERKWRDRWESEGIYEVDLEKAERPFYNLMMFPYPSAEGLHAGNMYAFVGADVFGRFKRMSGFDVFEPMGLDGFGIHSENFAIKVGRHPKEHAKISEKNFYDQLRQIGNGFAWRHKLETYNPTYYRWTQWLFIKLFEAGLAYKREAMVNWCSSCKTVLADEQVEGGLCERCRSEVVRKPLSSWHFRITKYANKLLDGLGKIDWPDKIKTAQRNWIGRKKGVVVSFELEKAVELKTKSVEVFTTRVDTLGGVSFVVISPEMASKWMEEGWRATDEVLRYVQRALNKTEQTRKKLEKDKSGVETEMLAVNPLNGERVPVWIGDYVLAGVGTGALMGVPAHDERDLEFARKYNLSIRVVVEKGRLVNSGKDLDGLVVEEGVNVILNKLGSKARKEISYHLRDWLVSRQRYWGVPIPMIECPDCGWMSVPEESLPLELPDLDDFKPEGTGRGPLAKLEDWKRVSCPRCGGDAQRETDVCDNFIDSSWYYLGYLFMKDGRWDESAKPFKDEVLSKWLPVNAYIGGAEHAVLHLLYARFIASVLHDLGFVEFSEPFPFLFGHGLLIKDGMKMSKSRGNVINPDAYLKKYGADVLRMYLMFLGSYSQGGDFRDTGMLGMYRFLEKIWRLVQEKRAPETTARLYKKLNWAIKKVGDDLSRFKYNTAIAGLMETVNVWKEEDEVMGEKDLINFIKLLAPLAPFLAEELYQKYRESKGFDSVHRSSWPELDESVLLEDVVEIAVQVNGKLRSSIEIARDIVDDEGSVVKVALENEQVSKWVDKSEYRVVFVAGRLLNFVLI